MEWNTRSYQSHHQTNGALAVRRTRLRWTTGELNGRHLAFQIGFYFVCYYFCFLLFFRLFLSIEIGVILNIEYFSDESYVPDWEAFVNDDGNLFYLEYNPSSIISVEKSPVLNEKGALLAARNEFKRGSTRRSKKAGGKLSKLISKHKKDKPPKVNGNSTGTSATNGNSNSIAKEPTKVKFSELIEGETKEVTIFIDPSVRHKFGRRTSVCEALCGISVCPFPASQRIMVAGYMPNSATNQDKGIKVGDWLKAIDNQDVTIENIDLILLSFNEPTKVKLTLQRMAVEEQFHEALRFDKIASVNEFAAFCRELFPISDEYFAFNKWTALNLMYLTLNKGDEQGPEGEDVLFCHPPKDQNGLYGIRGTFLTLNSLFRESTFKSSLCSTTVFIQGAEYHVASGCFMDGNFIFLF